MIVSNLLQEYDEDLRKAREELDRSKEITQEIDVCASMCGSIVNVWNFGHNENCPHHVNSRQYTYEE